MTTTNIRNLFQAYLEHKGWTVQRFSWITEIPVSEVYRLSSETQEVLKEMIKNDPLFRVSSQR